MCNRMTTLLAGALVLAISTWIPTRAEDEPVRAHYYGNSLIGAVILESKNEN